MTKEQSTDPDNTSTTNQDHSDLDNERIALVSTITSAAYEGTDECCDPDGHYYVSRDPWYTQSQTNRPTFDVMRGSQPSRPMTATEINAAAATSDPDGDGYSGAQRHPVCLDVPDVTLQGQRLLAYGERLRREEAENIQEPGRACPTGRPHRPPMERQVPEVRVRQPRAPPLVDQLADGREFAHRDNRGLSLGCIENLEECLKLADDFWT